MSCGGGAGPIRGIIVLPADWGGDAGRIALLGHSALAGGALLLSADLLARALLAPRELPVGVVTAVLGGGYLLWLLHRGRQT